jgi:hypothetical protein
MIILDLDNCIASDAWRIPRINWQQSDPDRRYHDYHSLSAFDSVGNRDLFEGRSDIIILTARPVTFKAMTIEWLRRSGVPFKDILMRNVGDHRPSAKLKEVQLNWLTEYAVGLSDIEWAADDRQDVLDMYASYGIPGKLRAIHNVCAYTMPTPVQDEPNLEDHHHGKD